MNEMPDYEQNPNEENIYFEVAKNLGYTEDDSLRSLRNRIIEEKNIELVDQYKAEAAERVDSFQSELVTTDSEVCI